MLTWNFEEYYTLHCKIIKKNNLVKGSRESSSQLCFSPWYIREKMEANRKFH